jgi:hypothetical protein
MLMNMKTKVLLLALLSGFVFSVSAQEFKPQVGFSNEAGYKTNFKKNKAATTGLSLLLVARVFYLVIRTVKPILRIV